MCHTLHCIRQGLCPSFLSFSPWAEATCCLPLSLFQSTLSHTLQCQMIHLPLPPPAWPTHLLAGLKPRQYARVSINAPLSSCQGLSCQPFLQCQGLLLFPSCFPSTPTPPVPHLSPAPQPLHSPHWIQISSLSPYTQALSACFKLGTDLIPSPSTPASPTATLQAHLLHLPVH